MTETHGKGRDHPPEDGPRLSRRNRGLFSFLAVCVLIVLVIWIFAHQLPNEGQKLSQFAFWQALYHGDVESLEMVGKNKISGVLKENLLGTRKRKFDVVFPEEALDSKRDLIKERLFLDREKVAKGELLEKLRAPGLLLRSVLEIQYDEDREMEFDFVDPEDGRSKVWFYRTEDRRERLPDLLEAVRAYEKREGRQVPFEVKPLQNLEDRKLTYSAPNTFLVDLIVSLAPWLLIFGLFWFFILRQIKVPGGTGGVLAFGKSRAKLYSKEQSNVTFADVAGINEAKDEVQEIIEFLKNPARFQKIGGRIPRGVLLVGPPGTGKTLLAKAIAGEADVPFFSISGSDFVEMFVGVGASRVRDLFKQAKENSPCIVFLDEIDAVGRRRGAGLGGGHDEREQTLNAILVEMDGFDTDEGIILVAATNRPDVLDPALLRPGRFDREITIDLPDLAGREAILKVHAKKIKLAPEVELKVLARGTPMFSGADLEATINEAALLAVLKGKECANMEDLEEARDKVKWGRQKTSKIMDPEEKGVTAYHEAGHALVACLLPEVEPLHKVTIIPRGATLGATMQLPEKDKYVHRRQELLGELALLFGGRVAEELCCADVSSGAQNDIKRATDLARMMVTAWGMSEKIGPVNYSESEETLFLGREITRTRTHSEATAVEIDQEVHRILQESYDRTRELLTAHRQELDRIQTALVAHEVLSRKEVEAVLAGEDVEEIRKAARSSGAGESASRPKSSEAHDEEYGTNPGDLEAEGGFAF